MKRFIIALATWLALIAPAVAQTGSEKTTAQLITETGQLFPDNTLGLITPFNARQFYLDLLASTGNYSTVGTWSAPQTFTDGPVVTLTQNATAATAQVAISKGTSAEVLQNVNRAGFYYTMLDTLSLGVTQTYGVAFNLEFTGNGVVQTGPNGSFSFWNGVGIVAAKLGDGSLQALSSVAILGAVGPGSYNEANSLTLQGQNQGSTNGYIGVAELLGLDGISTTAGQNWATKLYGVASRLAAYNTGTTAQSTNFFASSEGGSSGFAIGSVLSLNPQSPIGWYRGIDLTAFGYAGSGALFVTGEAIRLPNNANISWCVMAACVAGTTDDVPALFLDTGNNFNVGYLSNAIIFNPNTTIQFKTNGTAVGTWPTTAGTSGYVLTSSGGGGMTWSQIAGVYAPLASPTFTGTITGPDSGTWGSGGINGSAIGGVTPEAAAFTTLSASSTVSGTGFSTYLSSPPAIGGTAAAAITGTTIRANTGFSANGSAGLSTTCTVTAGNTLVFTEGILTTKGANCT